MADPTDGYRIVKFFPGGWYEGIEETKARVQITHKGEPVLDLPIGEWSFLLANTVDLTRPPKKSKKMTSKELVDRVAAAYDGNLVA